jgi:hypothetical protein
MTIESVFYDELRCLLNRCSMENGSNTPDFVLAEYLKRCLEAYNTAVTARDNWHQSKVIQVREALQRANRQFTPLEHHIAEIVGDG